MGRVFPHVVTARKGERIDARAGNGAEVPRNPKSGQAVTSWHQIKEARRVVPFLGGFLAIAFSAGDPGGVHLFPF